MDDWLSTLLGTVLIGGAIYVSGKEGQKQGYNQAMQDMTSKAQAEEIALLRSEIQALRSTSNLLK
jgi:glutamate synthase domain-containing protein 3